MIKVIPQKEKKIKKIKTSKSSKSLKNKSNNNPIGKNGNRNNKRNLSVFIKLKPKFNDAIFENEENKYYYSKNKRNFNNLIVDLESNEILNEYKIINFKKHTKSDKNVLKHMSLDRIKEKNKHNAPLNKKANNKSYAFILINEDNTGNRHSLKSNYILNNYEYEEAIKFDKSSFFRIYFIYLISKDNFLDIFFLILL